MDSSMDVSIQNMEIENIQLNDSLRDLEAENDHLMEQVNVLEKALEKEKKFHRKYADEVTVTEAVRNEDFRKEKRTLVEENKSLVKQNRQLKKDMEFYKKAHEELSKEDESTVTNLSNAAKKMHGHPAPTSSSKSTRRSFTAESQTILNCSLQVDCTHKSAKTLTKVNEKLFVENKKLKMKISNLSATIATLKKKVKQLENFRNKIDNKKTKFCQDTEELERLVASTQKKNKYTFNQETLLMLGRLVQK